MNPVKRVMFGGTAVIECEITGAGSGNGASPESTQTIGGQGFEGRSISDAATLSVSISSTPSYGRL